MTTFQAQAVAAADTPLVWRALSSVSEWPYWTTSISKIRGPEGPLRVGGRYLVTQPSMPTLTWTVTDIDPGRAFTWESRSPGIRTIGRHWIGSTTSAGVEVNVSVEQIGPLAGIVRALTGRRTRRYLQLEADGLAQASKNLPTG